MESQLLGSPSPPVAKKREKKPNLTAFPPKLVVEQLTVMDVIVEVDTNRTCCTEWLCRLHEELFRKVVPSECLGSTWGKRNKPGHEHLGHTVRATIDHFRRVASLVITTCLGDPSMTAQDRARVVERWIQVAQECKILKNFSSPRTVTSALQKTSICHLKNTQGKFPGKWKDGDRVVQASHGGDEVRGRKRMWDLSACSTWRGEGKNSDDSHATVSPQENL
ncbi:ral guanine nucleotide dissociation stimulator-like isoform X1 [Diceros bicornis minor]|uniref:ral guanine nucleotide dissociation stimulator-like isoform X1 n=1 Tax=Diceros bicornis minor TaxID=77932 RepID=UPI0026EF3EA6|nr:ral guanine nucleotide dissociation stimulator-like isoform X1 [Diceros bicornis minor]